MYVSFLAGALLHAAEAAHNSEPQHMLQHAPQDAIVQAAPALAPPQPAAPLDPQICLQQILHGQAVSALTCHLHSSILQYGAGSWQPQIFRTAQTLLTVPWLATRVRS